MACSQNRAGTVFRGHPVGSGVSMGVLFGFITFGTTREWTSAVIAAVVLGLIVFVLQLVRPRA